MKLNLRDLFWAVAVAALLAAWFASHRRVAERQARLEEGNLKLQQKRAEVDALAMLLLTKESGGAKVTSTITLTSSEVSSQRGPLHIDRGMLFDAGQATKRMTDALTPHVSAEPQEH